MGFLTHISRKINVWRIFNGWVWLLRTRAQCSSAGENITYINCGTKNYSDLFTTHNAVLHIYHPIRKEILTLLLMGFPFSLILIFPNSILTIPLLFPTARTPPPLKRA